MAELSKHQEYLAIGDDQGRTSSFAGGCEANETYSNHDDEASLDDRLDSVDVKSPVEKNSLTVYTRFTIS